MCILFFAQVSRILHIFLISRMSCESSVAGFVKQNKQHEIIDTHMLHFTCSSCSSVAGCRLSLLQREFAFDTFRYRVCLLPRQMPNSVKKDHTFCLTLLPHASFLFPFKCKPGFKIKCILTTSQVSMNVSKCLCKQWYTIE